MLIRIVCPLPDLDTTTAPSAGSGIPKPSSPVGQGLKEKIGQTVDDHLSGFQLLGIFTIIGVAGYIYSKHRGKTNLAAKDY